MRFAVRWRQWLGSSSRALAMGITQMLQICSFNKTNMRRMALGLNGDVGGLKNKWDRGIRISKQRARRCPTFSSSNVHTGPTSSGTSSQWRTGFSSSPAARPDSALSWSKRSLTRETSASQRPEIPINSSSKTLPTRYVSDRQYLK